MSERLAWVDASAGVAGDMLLGALMDAGAPLDAVRSAVEAVVPGSVEVTGHLVTRAGLRATKIDIVPLVDPPPHRSWADVEALLDAADLPAGIAGRSRAVFGRLAEAEGRVHGVPTATVHFHEVGALDSIADVVGVCAAVENLGLGRLVLSPVALGSGRVRTAHGDMPVPVPAVIELAQGWPVISGGEWELATPTGMALATTLCDGSGDLPPMTVERVGTGAGSRDVPGRANVTRVVIGTAAQTPSSPTDVMTVLEANIDDLDPRLWPSVLSRLLGTGASDAWLTPTVMKKGRPAHVLSVLARPETVPVLRGLMISTTTTLGVREHTVSRYALPRRWVQVSLEPETGAEIAVKVGHRDGVVVRVTPEFDDVARYAEQTGGTEVDVLGAVVQRAAELGYRVGAALPDQNRLYDMAPRVDAAEG